MTPSPFFGAWHPSVLKLYIEHGMRPDPATGGIRLKMDPLQVSRPCTHRSSPVLISISYQESVGFSDHIVPREVWQLLSSLDPRIEIRWIMADTDTSAYDRANPLHCPFRFIRLFHFQNRRGEEHTGDCMAPSRKFIQYQNSWCRTSRAYHLHQIACRSIQLNAITALQIVQEAPFELGPSPFTNFIIHEN